MRELSLHIMDIAENGISAGASLIQMEVVEDENKGLLHITLRDNGRGMSEEMAAKALDPFFTTRTTRRIGLGLSLLREASRRCEGEFRLTSREGAGTEVYASFRLHHIDLAPLGDMAGSISSMVMGNPEIDFLYTHEVDEKAFCLDTRELRRQLDGVQINEPEVVTYISTLIRESLEELHQK